MKINWIKMRVTGREWNTFYSMQSSYCFLNKEMNGVWIGFLIVGEHIPSHCELCSDEEVIQIDLYRKSGHIYPSPLEDIKPKEEVKSLL